MVLQGRVALRRARIYGAETFQSLKSRLESNKDETRGAGPNGGAEQGVFDQLIETKVESGTSQSKNGISVNLCNSRFLASVGAAVFYRGTSPIR